METPGPRSSITLTDTVGVFEMLETQCTPLTADEVTEALGCSRQIAHRNLEQLTECGILHTKPIGSSSRVWWRPATAEHDDAAIQTPEENSRTDSTLARYETLVETVPDGVYTVDTDGRFTMVNDAYVEMTGYSRDDLLGAHVSTVVDADTVESAQQIEQGLVSGDQQTTKVEADVLRANGKPLRAEATFSLIAAHGTEYERVGVVRDMSERVERERALEESERRYRTLAENFPNGAIALFDESLRYSLAEGKKFEDVAVNAEELAGKTIYEIYPPAIVEILEPAYRSALEGQGESIEIEYCDRHWDVHTTPVRDTAGTVFAGMVMVQEITERKNHERQLRARARQQGTISELGQRALEHSDLDDLFDQAARLVSHVLDNDFAKVLDLDVDASHLLLRQGVGWRAGLVGEATVEATDANSQASYTLLSEEPVVVTDMDAETRFSGPDLLTSHGVESGISTIIGSTTAPWGILGTHDTTQKSFSEEDVSFVQSIANILAEAIERHRYQDELERLIAELTEREHQLKHQRSQLTALNSLNDLVHKLSHLTIESSTREEIEQQVCEHLAASEAYLFAWIGDSGVDNHQIRLRTEAGVEGYLDTITIRINGDDDEGQGPTGKAIRTGEVHVTQNVLEDAAYEPWHDQAKELGVRSSAAIPIQYEGTIYGALNIYAAHENAFEEDERAVIGRLGEVIGHAINAIERKHALMSESVVELGFQVQNVFDSRGIPTPATGTIRIDRTIPLTDAQFLQYGTVTADAMETLHALVETSPHIREVTIYDEDASESRFEFQLSEPPAISTIAAHGGRIETLTIENEDVNLTVQFPQTANIRRVVEVVKTAYPEAETVAKRRRTRNPQPSQRLAPVLSDELTEKQRAALEAAYFAGFFEWPRNKSGEEVAESLGVSASTFHEHVRASERKLFQSLLNSRKSD